MSTTTGALLRKVEGLQTREVGGDLIVVDGRTNEAHALSGHLADVFRAVDAESALDLEEAEVAAAIAQLLELGLVTTKPGMSRRTMLRGATTVAVAGTVLSIHLPEAAAGTSASPTALAAVVLSYNTGTGNKSESVTLTGDGVNVIDGTVTITASANSGPAPTVTGVSQTTSGALTSVWSFTINNPSNKTVTITAAYAGGKHYTAHTYKASYNTVSSGGTGMPGTAQMT